MDKFCFEWLTFISIVAFEINSKIMNLKIGEKYSRIRGTFAYEKSYT